MAYLWDKFVWDTCVDQRKKFLYKIQLEKKLGRLILKIKKSAQREHFLRILKWKFELSEVVQEIWIAG